MDKARELNQKRDEGFTYYIRPQTFPIAVKMIANEADVPGNARRPRKDNGFRVSGCQGIAMARKYGWTVAMGKDDFFCAGMIILGFVPAGDYFMGQLWVDGGYVGSLETGKKTAETIARFDQGKYKAIVFAPLARAEFEPDEVMVYGNPAQMVRLVQGSLHKSGGVLTSVANGVSDCAQSIVRPIQSGQCNYVLSGIGNRIYSATEKDEMCFSIPGHKIDEVIDGLKQGNAKGLRYPIPTVANYQVKALASLYGPMFDQAGIPPSER